MDGKSPVYEKVRPASLLINNNNDCLLLKPSGMAVRRGDGAVVMKQVGIVLSSLIGRSRRESASHWWNL